MINTNSMQQCFDIYAMHPQIFRRLFSGAFHPLIHAGYGVEFNIPLILSEGSSSFNLSLCKFFKALLMLQFIRIISQTSLMTITLQVVKKATRKFSKLLRKFKGIQHLTG